MNNDELFAKAKRLDEYFKTKESYINICNLIENKSEKIMKYRLPRNPRESMMIDHDKKSLQIWSRQKERLKNKVLECEKLIAQDIKQLQ